MADIKLTAQDALAETPASGDLLYIVDVSDTTDGVSGSSKKITRTNLVGGLFDKTADDLDDITAGATNKHFTATDETKLDGIEALADVTDATNVAAAGATMDSELIATSAGAADAGKPIKLDAAGHVDATMINDADISLDNVTEGSTNKYFTSTEKTKLSGIETGADVTDATNVSAAGAAIITSGAGVPGSTPSKVGDIYIDTTNDNAYIAVGTASSSDWEISNDGAGGGISDGDKGDITVSGSGATWTIDNDVVTYAKMQNVSATDRILGRDTTGAGDVEELAPADVRTMLNVEDGADVTDATNVATAGAVMEGDTSTASMSFVVDEDNMASNSATKLATQQSIKAYVDTAIGTTVLDSELIATSAGAGDAGKPIKLDAAGHVDATMINDADISLDSVTEGSTNKFFTSTEKTKLSGIETSADVTDAANVSAAGAPIITSGAGAPGSTPAKVGDVYIDTTGDDAYIAVGTASSADWEKSNDGAGGGISDGDKGDITVSGSGATWTIDNDVVTYAKMQNVSATDRILGRITTGAGDTEELTAANVRTIINVADGANAYVHPNHSGDVTSVADGATTIANDAVTYAKMQNVVADNVILGNNSGAGGIVDELTATEVRTLINVENGADVTDTANVTAAGALMDSEVDADIKTLSLPASTTISTFGASIIDDADEATFKATVNLEIGVDVQAYNADLTSLATNWVQASASGASSLDFHEDTDNGSNKITLVAPASVASDKTVTFQDVTGTVLVTGGADVTVADGGTGASTLTGLLQGNGTSAITGITNSSTAGQVLRVTGASTYAWGALDLADTDAVTGTLPAGNLPSASTTASGIAEAAIASEVNTGTDTARYVTPDALAGSNLGTRVMAVQVIDGATALTTGDGKAYIRIPAELNGYNVIDVDMGVITKSTSGNPTVMLARGRQANATTAHAFNDVLSTALTIDANDFDSKDAGTAAVINGSNDDLATGDILRIDVDTAGTGTTGLNVNIIAQLP